MRASKNTQNRFTATYRVICAWVVVLAWSSRSKYSSDRGWMTLYG